VKKTKLKQLRQKALDRNPDEFYFGMMSRKGPSTSKNSDGTIDGDRGNQVLSQEASRLYKTQDLGYVRTIRNKTAKEVEELQRRAMGIRGTGKKVIWADGEDDLREKLEEEENGNVEDADDEDREEEIDVDARKLRKMQEKEAIKLEARLSIARERLKSLTEAEEALELQRAKMAKSPTIGGVNKHGVKYKVRERKR
jgi:U3 small nucleolar RNA-associated protein 11